MAKSSLCVLLLLVAWNVGQAQRPDDREGTTGAEPPEVIVRSLGGSWRVEASLAPSAGAKNLALMSAEARPELDQIEFLIQDERDWRAIISPEPDGVDWSQSTFYFFQAVPGVPDDPRYSGPKFDSIRDAFTPECIRDALAYTDGVVSLDQSRDFEEASLGSSLRAFSAGYESTCLRQLDQVPVAIRQVVGVLRLNGGILCSATIIGERNLLTSRHCFFNADNGEELGYWQSLLAGSISFHSVEPHSGQYVFSTRVVDSPSGPFAAYEDAIELRVIEGPFEVWAHTDHTDIPEANLPMPAWVVGSNALIGDVGSPRHPFEFVRGAAPNACALLEVTSAGCIYHTCQAGSSTSGAGLLIEDDGHVTLRGVHKGPVARAANCETSPPLKLNMNVAAQYPSRN